LQAISLTGAAIEAPCHGLAIDHLGDLNTLKDRRVMAPLTERLLRDASISSGMRILDIRAAAFGFENTSFVLTSLHHSIRS